MSRKIEDNDELNVIVPYKPDEFENLHKELSFKNFCISKKEMKAAGNMTVRLYGNRNIREYLDRHCRQLSARSSETGNSIGINWYIVEDVDIYDPKEGLIKEEKEGGFVF